MKPFCAAALITASFAATFIASVFAQYSGPKTVYILPMSGGLDQYVAQWLTKDHIMQVVVDPKSAEVVMTDRLGEAFEQKMKEIRPDSDKKTDENPRNTFRTTKPRGTIFLVDAKSRQVLWSDYQKPPNSNSDHDLNRTAEQIAHKLSSK
ncbi:MAG TPA: hypothetical protein VHY84_12615 [Bryobacteraceae bacterium]|jgi:hypothetical protein|nr:hypothetical protein [Bryobacteraceae bacterium]